MTIRLQKYLAEAGLGSRRKCEDFIRDGRVTIDGQQAQLGATVDPDLNVVVLDGRPVERETKEYWLLNKPAGVLTAVTDERGRPTVVHMVPAHVRVFPVGRLDLDSTGVLLLTNDGELTARLLHPRYHVDKEYVVTVFGHISSANVAKLRNGIVLDDGPTAPAGVALVRSGHYNDGRSFSVLRMTIHEGRKRQVRRMLEAVGHRVAALHRARFSILDDKGLALGQSRPLSAAEIEQLRVSAFGR